MTGIGAGGDRRANNFSVAGFSHDAHAIVLTPAGDAVRAAHPLSAAPTGYLVRADGPGPAGYAGDRMWRGGRARDSFGIGAALGEPVAIRTRRPGCGRELAVRAGRAPDQDLVVHIPVPARAWRDDVVATCNNGGAGCRADGLTG